MVLELKSETADAFMRKCLACPTNITARLVFADWLEETCVPHNIAWAYYIRLRTEAGRYPSGSYERHDLERQAEGYAPKIRANLTIPAKFFVGYPKSLLQLLPAPNITVKLAGFEILPPVYEFMPESVARENLAFPLDRQERTLFVAARDPHDFELVVKLQFILNRDIILVAAGADDILEAVNRHYGLNPTEVVDSVFYEFPEEYLIYPLAVSAYLDDNAPIARMVTTFMQDAITLHADRILITPELDSVRVRHRVDDTWIERDRPPLSLLHTITTQLAIMAWIPSEWASPNPPSFNAMTGEFELAARRLRFRVTIQPSPDGPTTQIDIGEIGPEPPSFSSRL